MRAGLTARVSRLEEIAGRRDPVSALIKVPWAIAQAGPEAKDEFVAQEVKRRGLRCIVVMPEPCDTTAEWVERYGHLAGRERGAAQ